MKFLEAIKRITAHKIGVNRISREGWPFQLYFDYATKNLMLEDKKTKDVLTPYVISSYDFDYEWFIVFGSK